MELTGYFSAILIGVSLGLIGGGGSILTLPVLVYLFGLDAVSATAYSLFIVGTTSLVGATRFWIKQLIDTKVAFTFAAPSLLSVYLVRRFVMPVLPETFFSVGNWQVSKDVFILLVFAIIMLFAAYEMIVTKKHSTIKQPGTKTNYALIVLEGIVVGSITGFVGAGGGFLIIPALVLLGGLPMKKAVATSLLIISIKSLSGFIGDVQNLEIDWIFLLRISALAIAGIFIGMKINRYFDGNQLKKGFGYFVLIMAVFILLKETAFA